MNKVHSVSVTELLNAGVHFGHNKSRWNPEMAPYIYKVEKTTNVHHLNLKYTAPLLERAMKKISETVRKKGKVLFVGTKQQVAPLLEEYIKPSGQYYINSSWVGGLLTNWKEVFVNNVKQLDHLDNILGDKKSTDKYTKKELASFERKRKKLLKSYEGIRKMNGNPHLLVVFDTNRDYQAITEALKKNIPLIAIADSNSDPRGIDIVIPGNDDALRSIELYLTKFVEAIEIGKNLSTKDSGEDIKEESNE